MAARQPAAVSTRAGAPPRQERFFFGDSAFGFEREARAAAFAGVDSIVVDALRD